MKDNILLLSFLMSLHMQSLVVGKMNLLLCKTENKLALLVAREKNKKG